MDWTEDIPVFRAQLADARRDLRRRLAADLSEQERLYVRRMAGHLGDLEGILDRIETRRIKLCDAPEVQRRYEESVKRFLEAFQGAKELRGSVVGTHLNPLADRLNNQPERSKRSSENMREEPPQKKSPPRVEPPASIIKGVESNPEDRHKMVDAYIAEVLDKTGKRITRTAIWRKAGYKSRTEFERWQRQDPKRLNPSAADAFNRVLREKPHLK